jgi:RNA polymerase sigma-70 factor (ECF subfamily)
MQTVSAISLEDGYRHGAEAALIQEAQQDRAAFAPLYQRYRDRVYAYLRTRTESAEDAADLTQQVFLQALDALPRYRVGQAPFAAWLLRIAHNAAARYHQRRRLTLAWDLVPESLHPVAADDPEAQALRGADIARLQELLRTCTPGTREVLALRFAARLTVAETAAVVGKSEAAVKKQLTRAISALKEQYHDPER